MPLEAGDQRMAVEQAAIHRPPLAIVDILLPTTPFAPADSRLSAGLDVVRILKQMNPSIGIVIFSARDDRGAEIWSMVRDGVRGIAYVLKGMPAERIVVALEAAAAGHVLLEPDVARPNTLLAAEMRTQLSDEERPFVERAATLIPTLTVREADVAWRVAGSHTNQSIANALGMKPKTVETHIAKTYRKLELNQVEGSAPALRKSLLLAKACMLYQLNQRR